MQRRGFTKPAAKGAAALAASAITRTHGLRVSDLQRLIDHVPIRGTLFDALSRSTRISVPTGAHSGGQPRREAMSGEVKAPFPVPWEASKA